MGIRLVVIDDNPHLAWEGRGPPGQRHVPAVRGGRSSTCPARRSPRSRRACRSATADAPPASLPLDPRIEVVGTRPVRRDRRLPAPPARRCCGPTEPTLRRAIAEADLALAEGARLECGAGRRRSRRGPACRGSCGSPGAPPTSPAGRFDGRARRRRRAPSAPATTRSGGWPRVGGRRLVVGEDVVDGDGVVASLVEPSEVRDPAARPWPPAPSRRRSGSPGRDGWPAARASRRCSSAVAARSVA